MSSETKPTIGWREWIKLPSLGIERIKAKIDTGARSSSIHALDLSHFEKDGEAWVRFQICPKQRESSPLIQVEAKLLEMRKVRSSNGQQALRPVIETEISLLGRTWLIELTLADRSKMGFRVLLGRESLKHRFLIDAGLSYCGKKKRPNKE